MTLEEFTQELELEFEELETGTLKPETHYRDIEGWSSMHVLIVIAFIDTHYDIILSAAELRDTLSVNDLYKKVQEKTN